MDEFALIQRYFTDLTPSAASVALGIGDDCALLRPDRGCEIAVTTDTLVAGRHFPVDTLPFDIGWKSLAVSLSDLAAMAAEPRWFTLALTLPESSEAWLAAFAAGLKAAAMHDGIALVGGDTTRGPLSITITAMGTVSPGEAMRRSGAEAGDSICVTGSLGDAALALRFIVDESGQPYFDPVAPRGQIGDRTLSVQRTLGSAGFRPVTRLAVPDSRQSSRPRSERPDFAFLYDRLDRPQARIKAGLALRGIASAAIDLSDGLAGDLGHVLAASGVGAEIDVDRLPMSPAFARRCPPLERLQLQAAGGDDYELCVCVPPTRLDAARAALGDLPLTPIGRVVAKPGLRWRGTGGQAIEGPVHGYRHFQGRS